MVHAGALLHVERCACLWRGVADSVVFLCNRGEGELGWPGEVMEFGEMVPRGACWPALRKIHWAVAEAARFDGVAAVLEYDALLVDGWWRRVRQGVLLCSSQYEVDNAVGMRGLGRSFGLCPWVTTRAGWLRMAETMASWRRGRGRYCVREDGFPDRFLTLAAQVSGLSVRAAGLGICTLEEREAPVLAEALDNGGVLFHGFKSTDLIPLDYF